MGTVRDLVRSARGHGGTVAFRFLRPLSLPAATEAMGLAHEAVIRMTVEVEELKLRLENFV